MASVREASDAPRNLPSCGETGITRISPLPFPLEEEEDEEAKEAEKVFAASNNPPHLPNSLDVAIIAVSSSVFSFKNPKFFSFWPVNPNSVGQETLNILKENEKKVECLLLP